VVDHRPHGILSARVQVAPDAGQYIVSAFLPEAIFTA